MLSSPRDWQAISRQVAGKLSMEPSSFWVEIDDVVADHFDKAGTGL
jgi:hypothetical protein